MILKEDGYTFNDLVNVAYKEIKDSIENFGHPLEEIVNDTNYSEICDWCGFPDLGVPESIYERAICVGIWLNLIDNNHDPMTIKSYIETQILPNWESLPVYDSFESYSNGDNMCMFIDGEQVNIPKKFYDAIKEGKL